MGTGTKVTIAIGALIAGIFGYRFYKLNQRNEKIKFIMGNSTGPAADIMKDILRGMKEEDFNLLYSIAKKYGSLEAIPEGPDLDQMRLIGMKYGLTGS